MSRGCHFLCLGCVEYAVELVLDCWGAFPSDLDMAGGCLSNKDLRRLHFRVLGEVAGVSNLGCISGTRGTTVSMSSGVR